MQGLTLQTGQQQKLHAYIKYTVNTLVILLLVFCYDAVTTNFLFTRMQGYLFASDTKMYIGICLGDVTFIHVQYTCMSINKQYTTMIQ